VSFCGDPADLFDAVVDVTELLNRVRTPFAASAACRGHDPSLWFPRIGQTPAAAKRICGGCPVLPDCLSFAMGDPELKGVWGATSEQERRQLRRDAA